MSTESTEAHMKWTAALITAAVFGNPQFFSTVQFQQALAGFRMCIMKDEAQEWSEVSQLDIGGD